MGIAKKPRLLFVSQRLLFALVSMLGMVLLYMTRSNTNFTVVCMIKNSSNTEHREDQEMEKGDFNWDLKQRSTILSSFYYGYIVTQIPGGILARYTGGKVVILFAVLASAILTLLSPTAAYWGYWWFVGSRIAIGLVQGPIYAAAQQMLAAWAPPLERATLGAIVFTGSQLGNVITMGFSGVICDQWGWEYVYYIFGGVACVWCVIWMFYAADTPEEQWWISEEEKEYILKSLDDSTNSKKVTVCELPWRDILTSYPVWAVFVAQFCMDYGSYTLLSCLPTFLDGVLKIHTVKSGIVSAVPYVGKMVVTNASGIISDKVQKRGWLSTVNTRRLAMAVAAVGQCTFLMASGWLHSGQETLAMIYFTMNIGLSGAQYSGHVMSYIDIAPAYSSLIVGMGNALSCVAGMLGPHLMNWITSGGDIEQWRLFFGISVAIMMSGAIFYIIFIQGHPQPWAVANDSQSTAKLVAYDGASVGKPAEFEDIALGPDSLPRKSVPRDINNINIAEGEHRAGSGRPSVAE